MTSILGTGSQHWQQSDSGWGATYVRSSGGVDGKDKILWGSCDHPSSQYKYNLGRMNTIKKFSCIKKNPSSIIQKVFF